MPKSSKNSALARQWEILRKIPSRPPGITAAELTSYLNVGGYTISKRSVERDLNDLSLLFGIACNDKSVPHGWYWLPNAQINFDGIGLSDALPIVLAENIIKNFLPVPMRPALDLKFKQARDKLNELRSSPFARWGDKVRYISDGMPFAPPSVHKDVLSAIQEALMNEVRIYAVYESFNCRAKEMELCPLALV